MSPGGRRDIAFLGHYTRDTIATPAGESTVDGGGFFYGASAAARLSLRVAAVTRLAAEHRQVLQALKDLGVEVHATFTPASTCLRLEYPGEDPDERVITVSSSAGPFSVAEVEAVAAPSFVVSGSIRGEFPPAVLEALHARGRLAVDVQGFLRVPVDGVLVNAEWPEAGAVLALAHVVKADAVEAESLSGERDIHEAARRLAGYGPQEVVLTHRGGLLVFDGRGFHQAPWKARSLAGRSGRGDTCLGTYCARRLEAGPEEATVWAAALTSLKMETPGPFRASREEVEELMRREYGSG